MPDFSKNLFDFYRFLSPTDSIGKFVIDSRVGNKNEKESKPIPQIAADKIRQTIIENFTPGLTGTGTGLVNIKDLIGKPKPNESVGETQEQIIQAIRGNYNVVYQAAGAQKSDILYAGYFADYPKPNTQAKEQPKTSPAKPPARTATGKPANPPPSPPSADPPPPPNDKQIERNYWGNVCDEGSDNGPPIDFSVVFMRAPMLSKAVCNTDLIQLYLTAMPPIFANQLMPYCDVEFQIPTLSKPDEGPIRVNRPSLYRFLMGSGRDISNLTEADKSIASILPANAKKKNIPDNNKQQTFFGMEMFTTPQTLVNMDTLTVKGAERLGQTRINDAKPFLPPATLKDVAITIQNAGAKNYGKRTASLKLHVHDRKRLAEMGEFLRGSDGYNKALVWITYGMLAPRNRGEFDSYAKFINENMLVRDAFVITNTQFTFTQDGGCEITLTLAVKGGGRVETTPITFGPVQAKKKALENIITKIRENAAAFGGQRDEKLGFTQSEIRMAQFISSAAEGNIPTSEEEKKNFNDAVKNINEQLKIQLGRGPDFNLQIALELVKDLQDAINKKSSIGNDAAQYVSSKVLGLDEKKDPFLPDARKNDSVFHSTLPLQPPLKDWVAEAIKRGPLKYYDEALCKTLPRDRSNCVSFGRIFSALCMPAILRGIAEEFNWSGLPDLKEAGSCPYEVQFIFYQLNNHCGPASSHNIAEFPMSIPLFVDGFKRLIESTIGGDAIALTQMFSFINEQLQDPRQPGYDRSSFYKSFDPNAKEQQKLEPKEDENKYAGQLRDWGNKYGGDFVTPDLTFEMEVGVGSKTGAPGRNETARDLLTSLTSRVGAGYTEPVYPEGDVGNKKTIIKFHIFDRTCSPLDKVTRALRLSSDGTYYLVSSDYAGDTKFLTHLENRSGELPEGITKVNEQYVFGDQTIAVNIGQGKEALMEWLGQFVPRIVVGTEGSLISQISIQSKTSGLEGLIAMQGGVQKRTSALADTGLSQRQFNLPMVLYPADMTMTTMGCPLASMGQHFFVDFSTNTTLDNDYVVKQVTHNIAPGKFETQWNLSYYDGYGRMISDNDITSQLNAAVKVLQDVDKAKQTAPSTNPAGNNQGTKK